MTPESLLGLLGDPSCYPHPAPALQIVQTHLSIVCLAGDRVYKLKKAKTLPFVDFAAIGARRGFCRDEVRLNGRLCPDTYLGTCSLRRAGTGTGVKFAALGDDDGPDDLDVAVVMKRLPQDRMLDELLRNGAVTTAQIEVLAKLIAAFHQQAERSPTVRALGDPGKLAQFAHDNFTEIAAMPDHGLPPDLLTALANVTDRDFATRLPQLRARADRGLVVDGHGDLHARNICMTDPPTVYDCIEFAPAFRCGDVATENGFLVMDLRYRGAPQLAEAYEQAYCAASGDHEQLELLPTLCSYRAMVRAKVALLAAGETELPQADRDRARESALRHLQLAAAMAIEARGPLWIVVFGPPASGKSSLCKALAAIAGWSHLATDVVRKELAGIAPTEHARAEHYTAEFSERTYGEVLARAVAATKRGESVVLIDGNFPTAAWRQRFDDTFQNGAEVVFVHVGVDAATAAARAEQRRRDPNNVSDADGAMTTALHSRFAAPGPEEGLELVQLDGTQPTAALLDLGLAQLLAPRPRRLERVHITMDWYDGWLNGIADFRGQPHYFHHDYHSSLTGPQYPRDYQLIPLDAPTLRLAQELDEQEMKRPPHSQTDRARQKHLQSQFDACIARSTPLPGRWLGEFHGGGCDWVAWRADTDQQTSESPEPR